MPGRTELRNSQVRSQGNFHDGYPHSLCPHDLDGNVYVFHFSQSGLCLNRASIEVRCRLPYLWAHFLPKLELNAKTKNICMNFWTGWSGK